MWVGQFSPLKWVKSLALLTVMVREQHATEQEGDRATYESSVCEQRDHSLFARIRIYTLIIAGFAVKIAVLHRIELLVMSVFDTASLLSKAFGA